MALAKGKIALVVWGIGLAAAAALIVAVRRPPSVVDVARDVPIVAASSSARGPSAPAIETIQLEPMVIVAAPTTKKPRAARVSPRCGPWRPLVQGGAEQRVRPCEDAFDADPPPP